VSRLLPLGAGPAPADPPAPTPAGAAERGRLTVSGRAAARIATAALTEVADLTGPAARSRGPAQVRAAVTGSVAELDVRCGVGYPAPVARTVERAREHLVVRLRELAGLTVAHVDVAVVDLPAGDGRPAGGRHRGLS
jgi:uncharacterized alkaline shock family protein YloU